jgi:hypothetical protein
MVPGDHGEVSGRERSAGGGVVARSCGPAGPACMDESGAGHTINPLGQPVPQGCNSAHIIRAAQQEQSASPPAAPQQPTVVVISIFIHSHEHIADSCDIISLPAPGHFHSSEACRLWSGARHTASLCASPSATTPHVHLGQPVLYRRDFHARRGPGWLHCARRVAWQGPRHQLHHLPPAVLSRDAVIRQHGVVHQAPLDARILLLQGCAMSLSVPHTARWWTSRTLSL